MSTGTKIAMALAVLFVGLLAVYYGLLFESPGEVNAGPAVGASTSTEEAEIAANRQNALTPERLKRESHDQSSSGGMLSEALEEKLGQRLLDVETSKPVDNWRLKPTGGESGTTKPTIEDQKSVGSGQQQDSSPQRKVEPASRNPVKPAQPPVRYYIYTIRKGDTMESIAEWWFGDLGKWVLIAKANPFDDPDHIREGGQLRLPPKDTPLDQPVEVHQGNDRVHIVTSGETLSGIAKKYYGNASKWTLIYKTNRKTIGDDPDDINVGDRLVIPPDSKKN